MIHRLTIISVFSLYIIPRVTQYLFNRSFWWDEAALAVNLLNRSYIGLIDKLEFEQAAPIGFLFVSKFIGEMLGYNEYSLRLFPLACSVIAIYLYYRICKILLDYNSLIIAMVFIAFSVPLIRYASEFKQYTTDMTSILLIFLVGLMLYRRVKIGNQSVLLWIVFFFIGIILPYFSYPSTLALAVIGTWLLINLILWKKWKTVAVLFSYGVVWLIVFYASYIYLLKAYVNNDYFIKFYRSSSPYWGSPQWGAFLPIPVSRDTMMLFLKWVNSTFIEMFSMPGGFYFDQVAACFFIIGCMVFWEKEKNIFIAIISIFILPIFLSAFELYPFYQRFVIFLAPFLFIIIAKSVYYVSERVFDSKAKNRMLLACLVCILCAQGIKSGSLFIKKNETLVEIRPALQYIMSHKMDGDVLFCPYALKPVIQYYAYLYKIDDLDIKIGEGSVFDEDLSGKKLLYKNDLVRQLSASESVWVILTYIPDLQKRMYIDILNEIGGGVLVYNYGNVQIYKYML